MSEFGVMLAWLALQVTLFATIGVAVYWAARRRGPTTGSLVLGAAILVSLFVTLLSTTPWPRWGWLADSTFDSPVAEDSPTSESSDVDATVGGANTERATVERASATRASRPVQAESGGSSFVRTLRAELAKWPDDGSPAGRWWAPYVAWLFLAALAIGLVRLAAGVLAVYRYKRSGTPISDESLADLLAITRARVNLRTPIGLWESKDLGTPATVGWRRPLIFLPAEWREWTEQERRVVLAHEVAHVARGDYLTWFVAQIGLAANFYHPILHWMTRRLRLEQELAADAWGASLAGGRKTYLATLARMALRQDDRRVAWAARPFLPTPGTFSRRIEMLRCGKPGPSGPISGPARALWIAALAAVGLLAAGLRNPEKHAAQAAEAGGGGKALSLEYVGARPPFVIALRAGELLALDETGKLAETIDRELKLEATYGIKAADVEQLTFVMDLEGRRGPLRTIVRVKGVTKFAIQSASPAKTVTYGNQIYIVGPTGFAIWVADERTFVVAEEPELKAVIDEVAGKVTPSWSARFHDLATGGIVLAADVSQVRVMFEQAKAHPARDPGEQAMLALAPLIENVDLQVASVDLAKTTTVTLSNFCGSPEGAAKAEPTFSTALLMASNSLAMAKQAPPGRNPTPAEAWTQYMADLIDGAEKMLKSAKVERAENVVKVTMRGDLDIQHFAMLAVPAVVAARQSAARAQSANNLKQLGLAIHLYEQVHKAVPPATLRGPTGIPYSWRVALLPYLELKELYDEYRLTEAWDSEHNKQVLAKMPALFRAPGDDAGSTNTSYFALVGVDTIISESQATGFAKITDGLSNTIMLVEAKRSIPWTKPEDIPYDGAKDLPELGGWFEEGFDAAMGDGSVRFILKSIDARVLRLLITKSDGQVIGGF